MRNALNINHLVEHVNKIDREVYYNRNQILVAIFENCFQLMIQISNMILIGKANSWHMIFSPILSFVLQIYTI